MEAVGKNGRYELRTEIGQGPRGVVFAGVDLQRRAPVVVRRFDRAIAADALGKYTKIARAIEQAGITGAVTPFEVRAADPAPFAVFPAHDGRSLESLLPAGALQWTRAVEVVMACAETLAAVLTATGEIHGGLKPSNVWITDSGKALVLDLGTAGLGPPGPVRRGAEVVEYRAPELLDGAVGDARADVFALAVLLVELTTGTHPFTGATAFQAAYKLTRTPPDLTAVTRGMSGGGAHEVVKLLSRALAGAPDERHADARAFAAALAYVRTIVGTPTPFRLQPRHDAPGTTPSAPPPHDPTTILRAPGVKPPALAAKPPDAPPVGPAAPDRPPPSPTTSPRPVLTDSPGPDLRPRIDDTPAPRRDAADARPAPLPTSSARRAARAPVPADSTEVLPQRAGATGLADPKHSLPQRASATGLADPTEVLPQRPGPTGLADPDEATIAAPRRRPVDDEATQVLPSDTAPAPVEITERDMRYRGDRDPAQVAPLSLPPDDDLATIVQPSRVVAARPNPESTLLLPEHSERAPTGVAIARPDPREQLSMRIDPRKLLPPASSTRPALATRSTSLPRILIVVNVCVAIALVALAWYAFR